MGVKGYSLFRSMVDPSTAFTTGYNIGNFDTAQATPSQNDLIASNVVDFGVWLYSKSASGDLIRIYPTSSDDNYHAAQTPTTAPAVIDVMVRLLTEEGASMISAIEQGSLPPPNGVSPDEWWWTVAAQHSRVFTRRIEVRSTGI